MKRIYGFSVLTFFSFFAAVLFCTPIFASTSTMTVLNDNGAICYNPNSLTDCLVIEDSPGNVVTLVCAGEAIPGLPGAQVNSIILGFDMNNDGSVAFVANIEDANGGDLGQALLTGSAAGPLGLVAATGQSFGGYTFGKFEEFVHINSSGQISFVVDINEVESELAVCRYSPSIGVEVLLAAGMDMGYGVIDNVCCNIPINDSGNILGKGWLEDSTTVLYLLKDVNDIVKIAAVDDAVGDGIFTEFYSGKINNNNQVIIKADVNDVSKLMFYSGGSFTEIVSSGDYLTNQRTVEGIPCHYNINDAGHVGYRTCFEDASTAVFYWDGLKSYMISQSGDEYEEKAFYSLKPHVAITENDELFFLANYSWDCEDDFGAYCWTKDSGIKEIIKVGDNAYGGAVTDIEFKGPVLQKGTNNWDKIVFAIVVDADYDNPIMEIFTGLCPEKIAGDINGDCKVNLFDFAMMAENWLVDYYNPPVSVMDMMNGATQGELITIMVSPNTLVLSSDVECVTVHSNIAYSQVYQDSVKLNGLTPYLTKADNRGELVAKFHIADVKEIVEPGKVTLTLTGVFNDGTAFAGSDIITVKK